MSSRLLVAFWSTSVISSPSWDKKNIDPLHLDQLHCFKLLIHRLVQRNWMSACLFSIHKFVTCFMYTYTYILVGHLMPIFSKKNTQRSSNSWHISLFEPYNYLKVPGLKTLPFSFSGASQGSILSESLSFRFSGTGTCCGKPVFLSHRWCSFHTLDGWNLKQPPGMYETPKNNGINYQPQLVNAGFQPSTVCFQSQRCDEKLSFPDFNQPQPTQQQPKPPPHYWDSHSSMASPLFIGNKKSVLPAKKSTENAVFSLEFIQVEKTILKWIWDDMKSFNVVKKNMG